MHEGNPIAFDGKRPTARQRVTAPPVPIDQATAECGESRRSYTAVSSSWLAPVPDQARSGSDDFIRIILLAIAYAAAGALGQLVAIPPGIVSAIWPPSGIALAALLLWGQRTWPGIWLGSLVINAWPILGHEVSTSPVVLAAVFAAIATGSTVQALVGRRLVIDLAGGTSFLNRTSGVFAFTGAAAAFCLIAASLGAVSLYLGRLVPGHAIGMTWRTWWLGDLVGVLMTTPLLLAWLRPRTLSLQKGRWLEAAALAVLLLTAGEYLFGPNSLMDRFGVPAAFLVFPLLTWAALRFGLRGATAAVFVAMTAATVGAARGAGAFQNASLHDAIWDLQLFGSVLAVSTFALAAVVSERTEAMDILGRCNQTLESRITERTATLERRAQELAKSEQAVRNNAEMLRSVLNNILEGVVVADRQGRVLLWNPAAAKLVGLKGEVQADLKPPDWPSLFGCFLPDRETPYPSDRFPLARALRGETVHEDEMYLQNDARPNGIWLRMSAVPLRQDDGTTAGGVVVFRDVTNRRLMEDQLRPVIEGVLAGILLIDRAGRISMVNRQAEVIFGQPRVEICGQNVGVLIPEDVLARGGQNADRRRSSDEEEPTVVVPARRKDGSEFPAEIAIRSYELYGESFTVATIRDLTEHRRLTRALERSLLVQSVLNRVLRAAFESSGGEQYLQNALNAILEPPLFGTDAAAGIFISDEAHSSFKVVAQQGLSPELLQRALAVRDGRCICGDVGSHRGIMACRDPALDETAHLAPVGPLSYCVPLIDARAADGHAFSVIYLVPSAPRALEPKEETELLSALARVLAVTIERHRTEEALVRSERRLSLVLDATHEGVWDWNIVTGEVYYSSKWIQSLGYVPEEVPPHVSFWESLVHPDDKLRVHERLEAHLQGKTPFYECENRLRTKSGTWRWNLDKGKVVERDEWGRSLRMVGTDTDITERKRAEAALRESEERFDLAVRGTNAGIWDWDLRTNRVYFSPRWKSMLGYSETEIGDDLAEWKSRLHPEDQARALETVSDYMANRSGDYELEHRLRHKDGSYRWILARGAALRDANGEPYRMVGSHIDISTQKRTSEQLSEKLFQLRAARKIQQSLLPKVALAVPGIEVAGISRPAAFAGGDMYDYLALIGNNIGIAVGDVCGHGVAAALQMASVHAYLRALAQTCATVGEIVSRLNQFIAAENNEGFVTLILIRIDPKTRNLVYANAGHPPGFVLNAAGDIRYTLNSGAMPLGVADSMFVPVAEPIVLEPGDLILLLTDGILEAESPSAELFGNDRALETVRAARDGSPAEILEALRKSVLCHLGGNEPNDDLTAVVIKISD